MPRTLLLMAMISVLDAAALPSIGFGDWSDAAPQGFQRIVSLGLMVNVERPQQPHLPDHYVRPQRDHVLGRLPLARKPLAVPHARRLTRRSDVLGKCPDVSSVRLLTQVPHTHRLDSECIGVDQRSSTDLLREHRSSEIFRSVNYVTLVACGLVQVLSG
jgi:hypothetical protein